ncbi:HWE histidine kinase domain-containing protein [Qipengyuania sp. JC766]|uniref:HWE histidine kinase domain-containing protein n=1 Tax=Qipengyuania sp. JC766 TaxID=3232139 RepID=UPI00345A8477
MNVDFKEVLDHSPNPYVLLDAELVLVWANKAYLTVTGREWSDIGGRQMFDAFPSTGESHDQLESSLNRVLETGEPDELAHIRYDIPNSSGGFDTHVWSATHTPIKDQGGAVTHVLQHTVQITGMETSKRGRDAAGIARRAEAVERRYRGASQELERVRLLLEQAPGFVAVLSGKEHRFVMANAAYRQLIGHRELVGRTVAEALPEVIDQGFVDVLDQVLESGDPYIGKRQLVMLGSADDADLKARHLEFIFQPIHGREGFEGIYIQGYDVSEEVVAEEHQRILINELNHRVKNTLAVVQGLAQQSFRRGRADPALNVFTDRLAALASAHTLLTEQNWESADLKQIVCGSLKATAGDDEGRYTVSGPAVVLQPQAAVTLSMVIHELCTNALKYGALSGNDGHVAIDWTVATEGDARVLNFKWKESGGPPVSEPETTGFGSRLIQRGLAGTNDNVELEFHRDGLRCRIRANV